MAAPWINSNNTSAQSRDGHWEMDPDVGRCYGNLIGDDTDRVPDLSKDPRISLHLYGKADVKKTRKWATLTASRQTRLTNGLQIPGKVCGATI